MTRPWPSIGIGWILALTVLILGILHFAGVLAGADVLWVAVVLLALALLL